MHHLLQIKEEIKHKAFQLGFSYTGVTSTHPVPHIQDYLNWVSAGYHADMHYLAREDAQAKRADPNLILEGCQRVICLAMPYHPPKTQSNQTPPGHGRISAYARTHDYHTVIQEKLTHLEAFIHTLDAAIIRTKSYVDTGPVLERAFAASAGIGGIGKNTSLIIPGIGSYLFLAEILTDLPLPMDPPFTRDLCGSCQRCIAACPTGCIHPERTIDASRCISYLTIENKGIIPDPLKTQLGDWLFGCDICQMVCPHNAQSLTQSTPLEEPRLPEYIDLVELLTWDETAFSTAFKTTPLWRAKRRGLIRNAAVVLGNQRHTPALPALEALLKQDPDPVINDACAWAIHQAKGERG